jgi:hypothetical protein
VDEQFRQPRTFVSHSGADVSVSKDTSTRAIREFVACRVDGKTERQLVSDAQDLLLENPLPSWVEALALLRPEEILDAYGVLESELHKLGVLPDSDELRLAVRQEVTKEAAILAGLSTEREVERTCNRIGRLLKLLPSYQFDELTIPIVEYPYPPSGIGSPAQLAEYVMSKLDRLVPYR